MADRIFASKAQIESLSHTIWEIGDSDFNDHLMFAANRIRNAYPFIGDRFILEAIYEACESLDHIFTCIEADHDYYDPEDRELMENLAFNNDSGFDYWYNQYVKGRFTFEFIAIMCA